MLWHFLIKLQALDVILFKVIHAKINYRSGFYCTHLHVTPINTETVLPAHRWWAEAGCHFVALSKPNQVLQKGVKFKLSGNSQNRFCMCLTGIFSPFLTLLCVRQSSCNKNCYNKGTESHRRRQLLGASFCKAKCNVSGTIKIHRNYISPSNE